VRTFAQIERAEGIHYDKGHATRSPLSAWYDSVRKKKFSRFSMGDWCRSVRQEMYLEYIMGYVLGELRKDPLAGAMYEGELANALTAVGSDFWTRHEKEKQDVNAFLRSHYETYPDDIKRNIDELLRRWNRGS
jgi:hypothetical protein